MGRERTVLGLRRPARLPGALAIAQGLKKAMAIWESPEDGNDAGPGICHGSRSLVASDPNPALDLHQKEDCIGSHNRLPSGMEGSRLLSSETKVLFSLNILSSTFLCPDFILSSSSNFYHLSNPRTLAPIESHVSFPEPVTGQGDVVHQA